MPLGRPTCDLWSPAAEMPRQGWEATEQLLPWGCLMLWGTRRSTIQRQTALLCFLTYFHPPQSPSWFLSAGSRAAATRVLGPVPAGR